MPKTLILCFFLILICGSLLAGDYQIGDGTSTQNYVPLTGNANYSWSKFLFSNTELQDAGLTTSQQITRLLFQVGNACNDYMLDNQQVYLRAGYDAQYASGTEAYPGTSGFTLVFSGSIRWYGPGWVEIVFDTPYNYNSNWGLEILWENRNGSYSSGYPKFRYTSNGSYTCVYKSGTTFPTTNGSRYKNRPNIWFATPTLEAPTPAQALLPETEATDIPIATSLRWNHTGGSPTGYRLWLWKENPTTYIASGLVVEENRFFPDDFLDYGTEHFWRIVPFNDNGSAVDCPMWSFTTVADPAITEFPHAESFDAAFLPPKWENWKGNLSDPIVFTNPGSTTWVQDDWLNISGTDKAAKLNLTWSLGGYLISPMFIIPDDTYVLEFDAALLKYNQTPQGTPPATNGIDDRFAVLVGNGYTWSMADIVKLWDNAESDYTLNNIVPAGQRMRVSL
ncbi:MAG TPA: hypothetical protein PKI59_01830 [Candidatus Cloacimonadota bacterium]|nr:hypothetical protein [Candidatus Cloacimonadota bacterium]